MPIFPLPETVFFPKVVLPLHLFEPRYRQMGEDVIAGDSLLVVVLLRPGWERDYEGTPPIHDIATLGRIEESEEIPDGRYNIALRGLERVRLLPAEASELAPGKPYRQRAIEPIPERRAEPGGITSKKMRGLRDGWLELLEKSGKSGNRSLELPARASFEVVVNHISSFIDVPPWTRQALLEENGLSSRAGKLLGYLDEQLQFWRTLAAFRHAKPGDPTVN